MKIKFDELNSYLVKMGEINIVGSAREFLNNIGIDNMQDKNSYQNIKNSLLESIEKRTPFSLVRCGDGEGNVLFWHLYSETLGIVSNESMKKIMSIMFGRNSVDQSCYRNFYDGISLAIINSDYLGLPTIDQLNATFKKLENIGCEKIDIRGVLGYLGVWDWVLKNSNQFSRKKIIPAHAHLQLVSYFVELIVKAGNISIITCYEGLLDKIKSVSGVSEGREYIIPPQACNINGTPEQIHYPNVYEQIKSDLESDLSGHLFFISAGLLGKLYCNIVKKSGGMAIDIGSIADVWMSTSVRAYHSEGYVKQHAL